jgi:hypothetical protein
MSEQREWWVIYHDDEPRRPRLLAKGELRAPDYGGFVAAAQKGSIGERRLAGMYIIVPRASRRIDVIATYGDQPPEIGIVGMRTLKL